MLKSATLRCSLSTGIAYRWNAEDELDTLPLKLPKRVFQKLERIQTKLRQIIAIPLACLFMRWIINRALVHGIKVQLEKVVRFLVVVFWIAQESPAFQPAISHVVRDRGLVLAVVFMGRFARPLLYVLGIWPVWPVAVGNPFDLSGPAFCVKCRALLT